MSDSVILEEEIDENYEPTREEVEDYAEWLGMKLPEDEEFLYIAREGLKAPLPEPWKPCQTKEGEIYFFNFETGSSVWEHPCDQYYKKQFQEAKARKKKAPRKESQPKVKQPASKSPVSFDKKQDPLLEITQLEKDFKEQKSQLQQRCEAELKDHIQDLKRQKELEAKHFQDQCEKELKKKRQQLENELDSVEQDHQKAVHEQVEKRSQEIKDHYDKLIAEEKKKSEEQLKEELEQIRLEQQRHKDLEIQAMQNKHQTEKKKLQQQIQEQIELQERYKKKASELQEDLDEELKLEHKKLQKSMMEELDSIKTQNEQTIKKLQTENSSYKSNLEDKIKELHQEYQLKLKTETDKINESYQKQIETLQTQEPEDPLDTSFDETEKERTLDELHKKYQIKKKAELNAIDKEFDTFYFNEKKRIEEEIKESFASESDFHLRKLREELNEAKALLQDKENQIHKAHSEISKYKEKIQKLKSKDENPSRIEKLEREIQNLRRFAEEDNEFELQLKEGSSDEERILEEWRGGREVSRDLSPISHDLDEPKRPSKWFSEMEELSRFRRRTPGSHLY